MIYYEKALTPLGNCKSLALCMCWLGEKAMIRALALVTAKKEHFHKGPFRFFVIQQLPFVNDSDVNISRAGDWFEI